jgi:hypothetical protein
MLKGGELRQFDDLPADRQTGQVYRFRMDGPDLDVFISTGGLVRGNYDPVKRGAAEHIKAVIDRDAEELGRGAACTETNAVALPCLYKFIDILGREEVGQCDSHFVPPLWILDVFSHLRRQRNISRPLG